MKLKRIIVKHFGIFRDPQSFDVDHDLVVIYGPNFSGKTTLLRAAYFALCGDLLPAGVARKHVVSTGQSSATAGLVYSHEGSVYRIYRSTRQDVQFEQAEQDGWRQRSGTRLELPDFNAHQWQMSCVLQEEELGEFLTKTTAKRRDLVHQILGIDAVLAAQEAIIRMRRLAKRKEKSLKTELDMLPRQSVEDCAEALNACRADVARLEHRLAAINQSPARSDIHDEWQRQYETLQRHLHTLTTDAENLLAGFADSEELADTLRQVTEKLAAQEHARHDVEQCVEQRIGLSTQLRQAEEHLDGMRQLQGKDVCPTCLQTLSPDHLRHFEETAAQHIETLRAALKQAQAEEKAARETETLFRQLAGRETELQRRLDQLTVVEREIRTIRTQCDAVQRNLASTAEPATESGDGSAVEQELEDARTRLIRLEAQDARAREYRCHLDTLAGTIHNAARHRLQSEWIADAVEQTLRAAMGASWRHVEERVVSCLRQFGLLHQDASPALGLDQSFLMPEVDGRMFRMLSGSEKAILYLSMKLAVSTLMPGADFMLLDNPTLHLDDQRRQQMRDYLLNAAGSKQLIILTNDSVFADLFPHAHRINLMQPPF